MPPKKSEAADLVESALHDAIFRLLSGQARWNKPKDDEAFNAFDELVKKGCDPVFLMSRLVVIAEAHRIDTWKGLTGFADSDRLQTALKRLRVCADDIEKLLGGAIGKAVLQDPSERILPSSLRNLAHQFGRTVRAIKPRHNLTSRVARRDIVRHVENRTGGPHDRLVAAILYPALRCDERTQSQWRHDNPQVLISVRGT